MLAKLLFCFHMFVSLLHSPDVLAIGSSMKLITPIISILTLRERERDHYRRAEGQRAAGDDELKVTATALDRRTESAVQRTDGGELQVGPNNRAPQKKVELQVDPELTSCLGSAAKTGGTVNNANRARHSEHEC